MDTRHIAILPLAVISLTGCTNNTVLQEPQIYDYCNRIVQAYFNTDTSLPPNVLEEIYKSDQYSEFVWDNADCVNVEYLYQDDTYICLCEVNLSSGEYSTASPELLQIQFTANNLTEIETVEVIGYLETF